MFRTPLWYKPAGDPATSDEPPIPVYYGHESESILRQRRHVALTSIDPETGVARDIAMDTFDREEGTLYVSTVFLALDHGWDDGPPVLWESLPFKDGSGLDRMMQRYRSRKAAVAGHIALVRFLRDRVQHGETIDDSTEFSTEDTDDSEEQA